MPGVGPLIVPTGVAAGDRRTYGELKAELARMYNPDDANALAVAGDAINQAIRVYNRYNWPWEVLTHQVSVVADVDSYPLPQPFKAAMSGYLTDSGRKHQRLAYIPYETFVAEYDLKQNGGPYYYTLKNTHETGQVTVWPRPQSAATAEFDYYRRTPMLKSDAAPLEMPGEAEGAMMQWAAY